MTTFDIHRSPDEGPVEEKRGRLRASQACEVCRVRKRKCSGQKPVCGRCNDKGLKCVWSDVPPHRHAKPRFKRGVNLAPLLIPNATNHSSIRPTLPNSILTPLSASSQKSTYQHTFSVKKQDSFSDFRSRSDSDISSDSSSVSWAETPERAVFEANASLPHHYTFNDPQKPFANPMTFPRAHFPVSGVSGSGSYDHLLHSSPISIDASLGPFYYSPSNDFELAFHSSGFSDRSSYTSSSTSTESNTSFSSPPTSASASEYPSALSQVTPSTNAPLSMPSPILADSLYSPAWIELFEPVVGSFLNPAPMMDSSCNAIPRDYVYDTNPPPSLHTVSECASYLPASNPFHRLIADEDRRTHS